MRDIRKYTSGLIDLVGHPGQLAEVYARCREDEELGLYILNKYNYMTGLIRGFSHDAFTKRVFNAEKSYNQCKNAILSCIENSCIELCDKFGIYCLCNDDKYIFIDDKMVSLIDGYGTICNDILNARDKSKALVLK